MTARRASREQLLQMLSKVALVDGYFVNVVEEGLGSWNKDATQHADILDAASDGETLRALLAGVCVERAGPGLSYGVRQDIPAAPALLDRLVDKFVLANHFARIAVGALQCSRYAS